MIILIKKRIPDIELIPPRNTDTIIDYLTKLLKRDLPTNTRDVAIRNYSWNSIIKNTIKTYKLLEEKYELGS